MKKLLLLLLFIPLMSIGQITYKDVMSIKSVDTFKKVAIENGYEFNGLDEDDFIMYGFDISKDSINGNKSTKWLYYDPEDDIFVLQFSRKGFFGLNDEGEYDLIIAEIKEKCSFYKIIENDGTDFVSYSCPESSYEGKIGFVVMDDTGVIMHFPNELFLDE